MSGPRHLWSGDWEQDSAAVTEELATRRAQTEEPVGTGPEVSSGRARPRMAERFVAWLRRVPHALRRPKAPKWLTWWGPREVRAAALVALLVLITAGAAFGVTLLVDGSGGQGSSAAKVHSWLGIDVAGSPFGIVITDVVPGSPAANAGLEPGDMINEINNHAVGTVDGVSAALTGLHPGDTIEIQFTRGLSSYTTQAQLAAHPANFP
jgi:hypothetical protein